jgi:hypothetical protein
MLMPLKKIVSGGQTGVDRGALDAALAVGFPCGGWCPQGRKAEDGAIPDRYPLQELPGAGYLQRTRKNVEDSDGTLILTFGPASGGTLRTIEFCRQMRKPHIVIDAAVTSFDEAAQEVLEFVKGSGVGSLNVAGPRASGEPRGSEFAIWVVERFLAKLGQQVA